MYKLMFLPFVCGLMALNFTSNAQIYRLYGFVQPVDGGAGPEMVDGKMRSEVPAPGSEPRYFIYASTSANLNSQMCQVSLNNKEYSCTLQKVPVPVILPSSDPGIFRNDTLITTSQGTLFRIDMQKTLQAFKFDSKLKKLKVSNELVLAYKIQNKVYYATVKHLKVLHPLFTERAHMN